MNKIYSVSKTKSKYLSLFLYNSSSKRFFPAPSINVCKETPAPNRRPGMSAQTFSKTVGKTFTPKAPNPLLIT